MARFALVCKVPPSITQSLSLAERFHQTLCKYLGDGVNSPSLTGLDDDRQPLTGNAHVYFLPECDPHGYVTHMTLHAPCGFDENATRTLDRIREIWGMEGKGFEIKIVLLATGHASDFQHASPYFPILANLDLAHALPPGAPPQIHTHWYPKNRSRHRTPERFA
ncbi:hypothetical protein Ga0100230_010670 [Opitutaceae bacterium TAV3]|nr:hypothetical protein Ga0100230_010670 [Opitutaceae bacterium TAV3]